MNPWHLRRAVAVLRRGGVVLHATEGVWGYACDPWNARAVAWLLTLKARALDKGLIVIGAGIETFAVELRVLDGPARDRVAATWPGPVTWLLPNRRFPAWVTGGRPDVAVRVPGHRQARCLCRAFGGPLVSTSANRAGRPSPRNRFQARAAVRDLQRRGVVARRDPRLLVLPGETGGRRGPSEIRTLAGAALRGGA